MKDDPEQRVNLYKKYPEKVEALTGLLKKYIESGENAEPLNN
jgi:hypothetical protein